jgi:peptidoglycan hydrolase CwlO-like protein
VQKKTHTRNTHPLLDFLKEFNEYRSIITAILSAFVAGVAIVISIRTQPIVDSIRTLDLRVSAVEARTANIETNLERYSSQSRDILSDINGELGLIKGELKRIK